MARGDNSQLVSILEMSPLEKKRKNKQTLNSISFVLLRSNVWFVKMIYFTWNHSVWIYYKNSKSDSGYVNGEVLAEFGNVLVEAMEICL